MDSFSEIIIKNFIKNHQLHNIKCTKVTAEEMLEIPEVKKMYEHLNSDKWLYGNTPTFTHKLDKRFTWGTVYLFLNVQDGIITDVSCNTDSLMVDLPEIIKNLILGVQYNKLAIEKQFNKLILMEHDSECLAILKDLNELFNTEI